MSSRRQLLALLIPLVLGCADFGRGDPSPDAGVVPPDGGGGGGDGGGTLSFATDVHPLLLSGCQSCHRAGGAAGDTALVLTGEVEADYLEAISFTDVSSPTASRLLRKAAGAGHEGGILYGEGSLEYQTLLNWISGGAQP
ncbi:MAG: hypothetical protein M3Y59_23670 [Myxococcota bacterium]|nr:hypothetical protein [Myxococcota bacterium]